MTVGFTFFVSWFVFKKVNGLIAIRRVAYNEANYDFITSVRREYQEDEEDLMRTRQGTTNQDIETLRKQFTLATTRAAAEEEKLREEAAKVDEEEYEMYEPLWEGLDLNNPGA